MTGKISFISRSALRSRSISRPVERVSMKALAWINLTLIFSMILLGGSQAIGQTAAPYSQTPVSTPTSREKLFIKTGAGLYLFQLYSTIYDRPTKNGIPYEMNLPVRPVAPLHREGRRSHRPEPQPTLGHPQRLFARPALKQQLLFGRQQTHRLYLLPP